MFTIYPQNLSRRNLIAKYASNGGVDECLDPLFVELARKTDSVEELLTDDDAIADIGISWFRVDLNSSELDVIGGITTLIDSEALVVGLVCDGIEADKGTEWACVVVTVGVAIAERVKDGMLSVKGGMLSVVGTSVHPVET
jgi:hypothetical protein